MELNNVKFEYGVFPGHPTVVWTEVNGEAELPCQVSTPVGDKINMVLWFKDQTGIPIYSFDARGVETTNGIHMALSNLEKRCSFTPSDVKGGSLRIFKITNNDAGLYKCRVDFSNSPTQQSKLTLAIADRPLVQIVSRPKFNFNKIKEGDNISLECAINANPPANDIRWFHDVSIEKHIIFYYI
ncbi:hypothetical protein V9T40_006322 [Parthenolecanium corni]|uniref:Ig-like domain-containing protein n=1 Tax=Parthenolecanium corni TaxID=536013 RepID=A0AAN9Y619_9HEMI